MAENILGLLLVSSTSRDRYVFRYPPDPTSPEARLHQPVYSRATYTARDSTVDHRSHRLFPRTRTEGSRGSGSRFGTHFWSSNASSGRNGMARGGSTSSADGIPPNSTGSFHSHLTEVGSTPSDTSSSSDDSDFDRLFDGGVSRSHTPRRYSSDTESNTASSRPNAPRPFTEIVADGRRGSVVESEATARAGSKRGGGKGKEFVEAQYNYALGYSLEFLGDLLSPPRAACNRKFEVCVDELVFIGHPVCNTPDGKWSFPSYEDSDSEDEQRRVSRGRRMNDSPAPARDTSGPLHPVAEHPESPRSRFEKLHESTNSLTNLHRDAVTRDAMNASANGMAASVTTNMTASTNDLSASVVRHKKDDDNPALNMFHLVLIIDKPDSRPEGQAQQTAVFNHLYREIAFKWTAAAFALQVKDNWVGRQAKELGKIREKAIADGVPVVDCLRKCVETSELAQSLHELFSALHKNKGKAINTHFSTVPTTVTLNVGSIPISIVLPPKRLNADTEVALAMDSDSSDSDEEGATGPDGLVSRQPHLRVEPWQTLLMLTEEDADPLVAMASARDQGRRNSRSQREEDNLLWGLIAACDITKPLQEIAHTLRYDLEGIVMPLARELIQSKRAILVDVVNVRLRNILIPASITEHLRSLTQHCVRWNILFPTLPPLVQFIAKLSMTPIPFRDLLPPEAQADASKRDIYIRAVAWLLKNDLVQQARVRARVIASSEVKEMAWRRIWHRRRNKWLRKRTQSMTSKTSGGSRSSRPSFGAATVSTVSAMASPNVDMTPRPLDADPIDVAFASRVPHLNNIPPTPGPDVTRTGSTITDSYLDYDSDLEMDSDVEGDSPLVLTGNENPSEFNLDESEPSPGAIPHFVASFIFAPARAQKDEARWLRVIREHNIDPVLQSRFDMCVQYFDGVTTFEEIMFRTSLSRRELDRIAHAYRDDLMITIQP